MLKKEALIVSSDALLRHNLGRDLASMNWLSREAKGGAEACGLLEERIPQVILVDGWLPDLEADFFKDYIRQSFPQLCLVDLEAPLEVPVTLPGRSELLLVLRDLTLAGGMKPAPGADASVGTESFENASVRFQEGDPTDMSPVAAAAGRQEPFGCDLPVRELIGESQVMRNLHRHIHLVAPRDTRILIEGETGTGKELVAQALHRLSRRASKPLITLNCAAIPETLLESELFGHARGAFTGASQSRTGRIEAADGGTFFLDEIGELSLPLQAKLLRFLENGELQRIGQNEVRRVDVRVIAATHRDLDQKVEEGSFRLDLLHRLSVFPLEIPSLRDRRTDIPLLSKHLLDRASHAYRISEGAMDCLVRHRWPGNVRELAHVLERAVILAEGRTELLAEDIRVRKQTRSSTLT